MRRTVSRLSARDLLQEIRQFRGGWLRCGFSTHLDVVSKQLEKLLWLELVGKTGMPVAVKVNEIEFIREARNFAFVSF
jgi:hypothetical protein